MTIHKKYLGLPSLSLLQSKEEHTTSYQSAHLGGPNTFQGLLLPDNIFYQRKGTATTYEVTNIVVPIKVDLF